VHAQGEGAGACTRSGDHTAGKGSGVLELKRANVARALGVVGAGIAALVGGRADERERGSLVDRGACSFDRDRLGWTAVIGQLFELWVGLPARAAEAPELEVEAPVVDRPEAPPRLNDRVRHGERAARHGDRAQREIGGKGR
jgi:hypothetical protein